MRFSRLTLATALLCSLLAACGGGGGGDSGGGGGGGGGGNNPPPVPTANAFLPTDTSIRLTYVNQPGAALFEDTVSRNSQFVSPFRYPTGGKEYYVSTTDEVSFMGFYAPVVVVSGAGTFTADARFNTPVSLFRTTTTTQQSVSVSGTGTVTITPTYGDQTLNYSGTVSYLGTQPVTNALGTFQSKHVRLQLTVSTTVQGTTFSVPFFVDLWFARDLGIVARVENNQALTLAQATGPDRDGDGVFNGIDLFPDDRTETTDFDGDGIGDNADPDDDNDQVADVNDAFPHDPLESADFDHDGVGDNADADDDGDGIQDSLDPFPKDIHNTDTDRDGVADFYDTDDDNDTIPDVFDAFPLNSLESADFDGDGIGDNGDTDDDNDGHFDVDDAYPKNAARWQLLATNQPTLSFAAIFGSAVMPATSLGVIGENIPWTAQSSAPWLQLDSTAGTGNTTLIVSTNTQGLAAGTYDATLTFTDTGIPRTVQVNVQITVTLPELTVTSSSLSYDGKFGWSGLTQPIDVTLNTGLATYPVSVTVDFDSANAISATLAGGVASFDPHRLNVTLDPSKLKGGRHTGEIRLSANVNGQAITRNISLEALASQRVLYPSQDGVALAQIGVFPSVHRTIKVLDSYDVAGTAWTATDDQPWLQVTSSGLTGGTLEITADPTGLAQGLYWANVTLASTDTNIESVRPLRVSLWVQPAHTNIYEVISATYTDIVADTMRPYVYAHNGGDIDVYNVHTRAQLASITGVTSPGPMVVSSNGKWLFVLHPNDGSMTRIDLDASATRVEWPLTDFKPPFGQPTAFVEARPNGHPALLLNDGRFVDTETGAVFPGVVTLSLATFEIAKPTPQGDRVCAVTTNVLTLSGSCYTLAFGDYQTADVRITQRTSIAGPFAPVTGQPTGMAVTADGEQVIVGFLEHPTTPVARYSVETGDYLGPAVLASDGTESRGSRTVATGSDGGIYADVLNAFTGNERIVGQNVDSSQRPTTPFSTIPYATQMITGVFNGFVVTGDSMGAVYLTGDFPPQPTVSTELTFLRTY